MSKFWKFFWVIIIGSFIMTIIQNVLGVKFASMWQQIGYDVPHMIWGYYIISAPDKNRSEKGEIE